ncbi:hypothetical protein CKAN_00003400 [Cinnamomum micranthum f. kanehirae]|uniref:BED-type domain-containing protein n=1 Tax=Cinnamomum micranthum f. kanehirae TaxID=337451 RepID=A0A3S3PSB8_9MAGN|nr:hypothetical protein CKAN_00003400 [Cinnamomum micranthum f. kanehirae]
MPRDIDPAWNYGEAVENNRLKIKCKFCGKVTNGGITRFKHHLGHISGNVAGCTEVPREIREQMKTLVGQNKARKIEIKEKRQQDVDAARYDVFGDEGFDDEDAQMEAARRESFMSHQEEYERHAFAGSSKYYDAGGSSAVPSRGKGIAGAMRRAFSTRERDVDVEIISTRRAVPPSIDPLAHRKEGAKQPNISSVMKGVMKGARDRLAKATAKWLIHKSIPPTAIDAPYFQTILDVAAEAGRGIQSPSVYDVGTKYLEEEYKEIKVVDSVGEENVVQIVTNNGANFKAAGRMLENKRPHLFWTPCATHCIDLIMEDIGKKKKIAEVIKACYFLNPEFYYPNAQQHSDAIDTELRVGLREVLKKLLGVDDSIEAIQEISTYTQRRGGFADPLAMRAIGKMPPADWWTNFGEDTPMLRKAAARILSQVTTSSNYEKNWSTFSLIHTKSRNRLTMQKLNKLVYYHYNLKLRNRTRERRASDDPNYCPISLDHIFREDDPLLPWIAEIEDPLLDSDPDFQEEVRDLLDEDIGGAEGAPLGGEGSSAQPQGPQPQPRGKEPAHAMSSSEKTSTTVSSSSHGGGDGGDGAGDTSGTGATSEYYQHDQEDVIPIEEVHDFPERMEGTIGYQRRRRPPAPGGSNEQGGGIGGQQAASWAESYPSYSGQGPSQYFDYFPYGQPGQVQQGEEQSSTSGSYSYGDYGETQYSRYPPPPPPPSSFDAGAAAFFGFVDPNAHQYQIPYGATRNDNNDGDEDSHSPLNLGRRSFWW